MRNGALPILLAAAMSACGPATEQRSAAPATVSTSALPADPLASWNDGAPKRALLDFVRRVTQAGGADFVPPEERIAVFDNDGTLWAEQPLYVQAAFALDRVKALAPAHPEWKQKQPFKAVLEGDRRGVAAAGERGLLEILAATHAGNTTDEFAQVVAQWIGSATHPTVGRRYTELIYQPMLEVMAYLRTSGFKTYIVSGGGIEFMRPWTEQVYGVPPEQVIGSRAKVQYEVKNGQPALRRLPAVDLVDDRAGKPVGIHQTIGRRPIAAFGNSDGDFEMLEWTTAAKGPRFAMIVHHTDAAREWAYDRTSHIGTLARGLDEAGRRGWIVADMRQDWKVIYPFQK
jgi:phosphoglycolate phosphatase-like HAD superfamily hydrolase